MAGDGQCYDHSETADRHVAAIKTDADGTEQWSAAIGDNIGYNYGKWAVQLSDGNFVIAGAKSVAVVNSKCGYIEHRALWVMHKTTGSVLSETLFPNHGAASNLRDGMMSINPTHSANESNEYVATGYVGGEAGCDDQPMFLIFGGSAFLMKLKYDVGSNAFSVVTEQTFNESAILQHMVPMQGMRVFDDFANKRYSLSVAATNTRDEAVQFGLISTDYDGKVVCSGIYPADGGNETGTASHPYAATLSSQGDGFVISGLALKASNGIPEG